MWWLLPPDFGRASRNYPCKKCRPSISTNWSCKIWCYLLDLGCGHGRHTHAAYFHRRCQAVGLDLGFEDVKITRAGFEANPDLQPANRAARRFDLSVGDALQKHLSFSDDRLFTG